MGSSLEGGRGAFDEPQFDSFEKLWADAGLPFGDAGRLRIVETDPELPDWGKRVVRASAPFSFLGISPYDRTQDYFQSQRSGPKRANYIPFAYDWRRDVRESARLFKEFLESLRATIENRFPGTAPLSRATLLSHSMGGLVVRLFLGEVLGNANSEQAVKEWMSRWISVGTPFFGTDDHMFRYYEGTPPLRSLIGGKKAMAELVSMFPGVANLLPLDYGTWQSVGAQIGLPAYPVLDATTAAAADPRSDTNKARYPGWLDPYFRFIEDSVPVQREIATALPDVVANRCHHFRSGKNLATAVSWKWGQLADRVHFDPNQTPTPLTPAAGPGDGTVPYWSAALPYTPRQNVLDLQRADDHGELLEHQEVLDAVWRLASQDFPHLSPDVHEAAARESALAEIALNEVRLTPVPTPTSLGEIALLKSAGPAGLPALKKLAYRTLC